MPPGPTSRHVVAPMVARIEDGQTFLLDREPARYRNLADTVRVVVQDGDTWHSLAYRHFEPIVRAQDLWWVICDFQPTPIVDPTIQPVPGSIVFIPSPEYVQSRVLGETQAEDVVI